MWDTVEERLALVEMLSRSTLRRRQGQTRAFDTLAELPWVRATGRRDEIRIVENRRSELVELLTRVWPVWRDELAELAVHGFPPTPEGWGRLLDARRAKELPELPERLNRRTAAALAAPHSKAVLTDVRRLALGDLQATSDGTVRLRPPAGLVARTHRGEVDLFTVASVLGEVSVPERAFLDGLEFKGHFRAVLLVENLGAWRDLPFLPGWLVVHVPGWETSTVAYLLEHCVNVPVVHFGDLDPNGVRIYLHLRERRKDLQWLVPAFWSEFLNEHGLRTEWPSSLVPEEAPELVCELATRGLWLEQERIVLDPRIVTALEELVVAGS